MVEDILIGVHLWSLFGLSLATVGFWLFEQYVGWFKYESPEIKHPPSKVQVRILTIGDNPNVVQQTVDALPAGVSDIHIISEQEITIDGAEVDVVPWSFTCKAEKKGRALEWGRRNITCNREFILYLDEDTQAINFDGLPDADVIQFGEKPFETDSKLAYWVEVFRMGFQVEMRAFSMFDIPLYAWGGGIAIRQELEDEITWDFKSIVEDTSFVWRSTENRDIEFKYCNDKFRNQAPPSIKALINQRRRWFAGSISELNILPPKYYGIAMLRNASWAVTIFLPVIIFLSWWGLGDYTMAYPLFYIASSVILLSVVLSWAAVGCVYMDEPPLFAVVIFALAPVLSLLNAVGALYGLVSPPDSFAVTQKADTSGPTSEVPDQTVTTNVETDAD